MKFSGLVILFLSSIALVACGGADDGEPETTDNAADEITVTDAELAGNPFMEDWNTPYGVPPFADIEESHYMPAVKKGILERRADIALIVDNPEAPTFENTIVAFETAGPLLNKVTSTFSNITGTELNDELQVLKTKISPMLSRESSAIMLNDVLFQRVQDIYAQMGNLGLNENDARLLELVHRSFIRNGAALEQEAKDQITEIDAEISELTTRFGLNLLAATKGFKLEIKDEAQTAGLSDSFKASVRDDEAGGWVIGLNRSSYETFMAESEVRELREQLFNGYRLRASTGDIDNGPLAIRVAQLRAKRAELMGYESHAHYRLETRMAKTPKAAEDFLLRVWRPGLERAKQERADMQDLIGDEFRFRAHDWWYYAEKMRKARFDINENELRPFFDLREVRAGAFEMANRLFGVTFEPVDIVGWNKIVDSFDVKDADGHHLGLLMMDMYARDSKRGGAWMSSYRRASNIGGDSIRPIITSNLNLSTPPEGSPTLMRFSEVETLFHEFGHGLHGLLTQVNYQRFAGTSGGPRDYTEFPAQILEHWASEPEMLAIFARHNQSGDVIPQELMERMLAAGNFNNGFTTTEFIAASLLDLRWHMLTVKEADQLTDARAFEEEVLRGYGLIDEIEPRYRSQYFSHIFAGGYSAGYYAYLWSEILDADGFAAFKQAENIFDPETAARLKKWVYESGGLREADELYRNFRGQDPSIEPLLEGRGFDVTE
jgi:peptidyl-dipeptidase Dcp